MDVQEFYEAFPYPPRTRDATNYASVLPSDFNVLNHYIFSGSWPRNKPLRILVAGGGTGDAAVSIGRQLSAARQPFTIRCLDLSRTSLEIAEARCTAADLKGPVTFECKPIESLSGETPGSVDYIDLCGVINHVDEPKVAMSALSHVLSENGGIGIMAYGALGRTGVYPVQILLRALELTSPENLPEARKVLAGLPADNWIRKNAHFHNFMEMSDVEFADTFLNPRDRAFSIRDLSELLAGAGLRIQSFIPPILYDPVCALADCEAGDRLKVLPEERRWELAEMLQGTLHKHTFYAVRADHPAPPDLNEVQPDWIARFRGGAENVLRSRWPSEDGERVSIGFSYEGQHRSLAVAITKNERALLAEMIDGKRFSEIVGQSSGPEKAGTMESLSRLCRMFCAIGALSIENSKR